jgi:hypothetical protein
MLKTETTANMDSQCWKLIGTEFSADVQRYRRVSCWWRHPVAILTLSPTSCCPSSTQCSSRSSVALTIGSILILQLLIRFFSHYRVTWLCFCAPSRSSFQSINIPVTLWVFTRKNSETIVILSVVHFVSRITLVSGLPLLRFGVVIISFISFILFRWI